MDRPIDRWIDRWTDRVTDRVTDGPTDRSSDRSTDEPTDRPTEPYPKSHRERPPTTSTADVHRHRRVRDAHAVGSTYAHVHDVTPRDVTPRDDDVDVDVDDDDRRPTIDDRRSTTDDDEDIPRDRDRAYLRGRYPIVTQPPSHRVVRTAQISRVATLCRAPTPMMMTITPV